MFRSFELRDGVKYLHQSGGPTSPMKICVEDMHPLDPWDPSTIQAIRNDVEQLQDDHVQLRRDLSRVEKFAEEASAFLRRVAQIDSLLTHKPVH
jgi:hypothetical protein